MSAIRLMQFIFVGAIFLGVPLAAQAQGSEGGVETKVDDFLDDRRNAVKQLLGRLNELADGYKSRENAKIVAIIRSLGVYRSTEAVPLLVDRIETRDQSRDPVISLVHIEKHFPAVVALVEIGVPAVGPLLEKISKVEQPKPFRMHLTKWILYRIYCDTEMVQRLISVQIEKNNYTTDQIKRLETFVRFITDPKTVLDEMSKIPDE